jgi:hypothetical protein
MTRTKPYASTSIGASRRCATRLKGFILCLALAATSFVNRAEAQLTSIWLADVAMGPRDWSVPLYWTLLPPGTGSRVVINNGVLFPATVNLNVDASISELTLGDGATLAIENGRTLDITGNSTVNGTISNSGTMRASNGATVRLQNNSLTNTGAGTIVADNGARVEISASSIIGGLLTSLGTGQFHALNSSTMTAVNLSAGSRVEVTDGHVLTLDGSISNNGTFSVAASGNITQLKFNAGVNLSGTGSITLSDSSLNRLVAANGGSSLFIGANQTISGAGQLGGDSLAISNQGTINATGSNALILNNSGTSFSNQGKLRASGGGGMNLADSTVTNQGTVEVAAGSTMTISGNYTQIGSGASTKLLGGTFIATSFSLQNGELSGSGTINGPVSVGATGTILPGGSGAIGELVFNHTLNLGPSSGVYFDLGGLTPGTGHDRINGSDIALNGSMFLSFTNGFQFSITSADTLTLFSTSNALSGTFAGTPNGSRLTTTDGFGSFQVNYLSNSLTLSNFQAIPEPSTWALLGLGSLAVLLAEIRRRRA